MWSIMSPKRFVPRSPRSRVAVLAGVLVLSGTAVAGTASTAIGADKPAPRVAQPAGPQAVASNQLGPSVTVAANTNGAATVTCPAGTVPTGGGAITSGIRIFFTDSFASGSGWTVRGTNTGTASSQIRAFAVCQ